MLVVGWRRPHSAYLDNVKHLVVSISNAISCLALLLAALKAWSLTLPDATIIVMWTNIMTVLYLITSQFADMARVVLLAVQAGARAAARVSLAIIAALETTRAVNAFKVTGAGSENTVKVARAVHAVMTQAHVLLAEGEKVLIKMEVEFQKAVRVAMLASLKQAGCEAFDPQLKESLAAAAAVAAAHTKSFATIAKRAPKKPKKDE
eukprot:4590850-Pleurochrysis_carterae.AAC.1